MPGGNFRSGRSTIYFRISLRSFDCAIINRTEMNHSLTDVKYAPTLSSHLCRRLCWVAQKGVYRSVLFMPPGEIMSELGLSTLLLVLDFGQISDPVCA